MLDRITDAERAVKRAAFRVKAIAKGMSAAPTEPRMLPGGDSAPPSGGGAEPRPSRPFRKRSSYDPPPFNLGGYGIPKCAPEPLAPETDWLPASFPDMDYVNDALQGPHETWTDEDEAAWMYYENSKGEPPIEARRSF